MAKCKSFFIHSIQALLLLAFLVLISLKIVEWQEEKVGLSFSKINNDMYLPSITLCPTTPKQDLKKSNLRKIVMMDSKQFILEANYSIEPEGENGKLENWNLSYRFRTKSSTEIGPCFTWNGFQKSIKAPQMAKVSPFHSNSEAIS